MRSTRAIEAFRPRSGSLSTRWSHSWRPTRGGTAGITMVVPTTTELAQNDRVSSSLVRNALMAADFDRVAALLGRPYRLSGHVIHGRRLGRRLGFPTLNLRLGRGRPTLHGVFAVVVTGLAPDPARPLPAIASSRTDRPDISSTSCRK